MRQRLTRLVRTRALQLRTLLTRTAEPDRPGGDHQFADWVQDARDEAWLQAIRKLEPRT